MEERWFEEEKEGGEAVGQMVRNEERKDCWNKIPKIYMNMEGSEVEVILMAGAEKNSSYFFLNFI